MTTTRYFQYTDSSAPTLNGTAGSLITVLDACLVNGYGSKTAAGWTKPYTGTNLAAYRNSTAAGGSGAYVRIDDTGPGAYGVREARMKAYKTMSDVNTGTQAVPSATNGQFIRKSTTLDSVARPWFVVADELTFYLYVQCNKTTWSVIATTDEATVAGGGDYYSFLASDTSNYFCAARNLENTAMNAAPPGGSVLMNLCCATENVATTASFDTRIPTYSSCVGSPTEYTAGIPAFFASQSSANAGGPQYYMGTTLPNPSTYTGAIIATDAFLWNSTLRIFGKLRGILALMNNMGGVAGNSSPSVARPGGSVLVSAPCCGCTSGAGNFAPAAVGAALFETVLSW